MRLKRWASRTRDWFKATRRRQQRADDQALRYNPEPGLKWPKRRKTLASCPRRRERCRAQYRFRIEAAIRARGEDYRRNSVAVDIAKRVPEWRRYSHVIAATHKRDETEARHSKRVAGLRLALSRV